MVGAGISGIGAGCHLQNDCPGRSYVILEGRDDIGGTWDLFRYPGVRSDSDMFTLGYSFRPWTDAKAIADGPAILAYLRETAGDHGVDRHIRFGHRVERASWNSTTARWTVDVARKDSPEVVQFTCGFLFMCSGYYNYDAGYTPDFQGAEQFQGLIVHPQQWPEVFDYGGKRVVVIGSGATAVTLVPEMARDAAHVTMLQRSPTYMAALPDEDRFANWLRRWLPAKTAHALIRWRNVLFGMVFFRLCERHPDRAKAMLLRGVREALGPDYDVARHFTPTYNPWEQRLCLVRNGDLFQAIREGRASVVTDHIETFTETGIRLRSGEELAADVVVTATGLDMLPLSGLEICVDGQPVDVSKRFTYKGMMLSDVPNLAFSMGYTNASWTLKCDLTCAYVCRLLNHMAKHDYAICCPRLTDASVEAEPLMNFSSGYVQRAIDRFPRQGSKAPWRLYQNYLLDFFALGRGALDDGVMTFTVPARDQQAPPPAQRIAAG